MGYGVAAVLLILFIVILLILAALVFSCKSSSSSSCDASKKDNCNNVEVQRSLDAMSKRIDTLEERVRHLEGKNVGADIWYNYGQEITADVYRASREELPSRLIDLGLPSLVAKSSVGDTAFTSVVARDAHLASTLSGSVTLSHAVATNPALVGAIVQNKAFNANTAGSKLLAMNVAREESLADAVSSNKTLTTALLDGRLAKQVASRQELINDLVGSDELVSRVATSKSLARSLLETDELSKTLAETVTADGYLTSEILRTLSQTQLDTLTIDQIIPRSSTLNIVGDLAVQRLAADTVNVNDLLVQSTASLENLTVSSVTVNQNITVPEDQMPITDSTN